MRVQEFGHKHTNVSLLLYGGGLSWWNYREAAALLAMRFHVVVPILDGHADNSTPFTFIHHSDAYTQILTGWIGEAIG